MVRTRTTMIRLRGQEAQRLEKLLESAALKLSSTISDIVGLSGRRMLEAMIAGIDDPAALAALADGRVKATPAELVEALTGRFSGHHRFLARILGNDHRIRRHFGPVIHADHPVGDLRIGSMQRAGH
jgi:transposase